MKSNSRQAQELKKYEMFCAIANDNVRQTIAMVLYSFRLRGYGKKRLHRLYEQFLAVINMPSPFGNDITCEDCMRMLQEDYGIDFSRINAKMETREQFLRR